MLFKRACRLFPAKDTFYSYKSCSSLGFTQIFLNLIKRVNTMEKISKSRLARLITAALFSAVVGGAWDVWWHGAVGRDTFWEPAHLLLYTSIIIAISLGAYGWYKTREKVWRWLATILFIVPLSAPFDELWHRTFGVEDLTSPLVLWSPPHIALILSIVVSFIFLLPILKKDHDQQARRFFTSLALSGILSYVRSTCAHEFVSSTAPRNRDLR